MATFVARSPVLVIMGVSGSGKSTIGQALAHRLGWSFADADDLHPPENIAAMAAGQPLDDAARAPWLARVAAWIDARIAAGGPGVIACSALRRRYRDVLRRPEVVFVHLAGSVSEIAERVADRPEHFMPAALLGSQFETLELPGKDEHAITVDTSGSPEQTVAEIIRILGLHPQG
ncbi:MAG: gluconokinase [Pseudonocardiales bacterium]|jgi:gluconokinase/shikimate kinase|nr:gluconokinase [Pseudonocardiales bacterium]